MSSILHRELTKSILQHFYDVYNALGYGFLREYIKMPYTMN